MSELGYHVMSLASQRSVSSLATLIISIIVFKEVPKIQSDDEERRKVQTNLGYCPAVGQVILELKILE